MKKLILILLFSLNVFANEVFLLPDESKIAQEKIKSLINEAKSSIFIAMYNFSYKKIAKDLLEASKNGTDITVLFDGEKVSKDDDVLKLFKDSKIKTIVNKDKNKMHIKAMLIDDNLALIGSTNFTKKSFEENYDLIYISKDEKLISKLKEFRAKFE
ncbi:phospholipase D-like domain-containing protein [Aliarcobacter lanthieri]|uniref:phospholipase D-like domain-containing protein n=2 Tax=Aliarcobacter lanthieri TaxID=1355374 RepID=UPI003AFABC99